MEEIIRNPILPIRAVKTHDTARCTYKGNRIGSFAFSLTLLILIANISSGYKSCNSLNENTLANNATPNTS